MQREYVENVKKQKSLDKLPSFCSLLCSKKKIEYFYCSKSLSHVSAYGIC